MQLKHTVLFLLAAGTLLAQPLRQNPKDVVATVDGRDVTREEVQQILYIGGPQIQTLFQTDPKAALFQWFLEQHLGKDGEKMKLDQQSPLKEQLEAVRMKYLADARLNLEMNGYRPSKEDIDKYYAQNGNRFQRVRVSGIYLKFKPKDNQGTSTADLQQAAMAILSAGKTQRNEDDARTVAADLSKRLRAGEDLAKLATEFSEDEASKAKGGDFGYVMYSSAFPQEFTLGALALAKGQVSEPIRLPTGFYVLRADDRGPMPMNDAVSDIETELRKTHLDQFVKGLNERFRPVIKDASMIIQPTTPAK